MRVLSLGVLGVLGITAAAQDISGPRIRAHVKFLASDLMEGRAVGTRGGDLASEYLATQLALIGAKPAGENGTWFQRVPLVGVEPQPTSTLRFSGQGKTFNFRWLEEFVGYTLSQKESSTLKADVVFAGHGITAPEYNWDDYRGVDVRGKVVIVFTGEPPSEDPGFFTGKALTYYGRWSYKYEEAARRGAVGCIIVHTSPTASYGWDVVRNSWGREDMQVKLDPGAHALNFAGWVTQESGDKLFATIGKTSEEMMGAADSREFRTVRLPLQAEGKFPAKVRMVESRNVVGIIAGSDPRKKDEAVAFSAHYDHLGIGGAVNGDAIYNGAVDNASGCAMLLEIARAWQGLGHKPRRSALFLFVTAEENGLRGSQYYAEHPTIPPGKIALNLNLDALHPFGRTLDTVVSGAERTTYWPIVQNTAQRFRFMIQPDPRPEAGSYYRSDHFSFAKVGVPAFSVKNGTHYAGKDAEYGKKIREEYTAKSYHQPSDEYHENWDLSGMEEMAKFTFTIGLTASNMEQVGTWKKGDEFLGAREKSGVR
jgi:Zn-dependent M28 family amino/carboxypeptidase